MTLTFQHGSAALAELLDPDATMRTLADGLVFTEGPVWNREGRYLLFSDVWNDARWRWSEERGAELVQQPNHIGNGMVYDADGELLVCEHVTSSVVRIAPDGSRRIVAFHHEGTYLNSPNDVVVRSDGSVYFSDPDYGRRDHPGGVHRPFELGFQGVYRVPPGGGPTELVVEKDAFDQPNGLCFSADEQVLYVDDRHHVTAFDVQPDGSLTNARRFASDLGFSDVPGSGNPDGMKCDERGNVWCAARGGVWILNPAGELLGILETPEVVANIAWGGDDWRTLFLCTSTTLRAVETRVGPAPLPYHR